MIQPNIRQKVLASSTSLERIKAMCQGAEGDCRDAQGRVNKEPAKAYYRGRADAYEAVLLLIKTLEEK